MKNYVEENCEGGPGIEAIELHIALREQMKSFAQTNLLLVVGGSAWSRDRWSGAILAIRELQWLVSCATDKIFRMRKQFRCKM